MKNKKLAILAAICLVTATTAVATGCKKKPVTVDPVYEVTLNAEAIDLAIGETANLESAYTQVSGATLAYASSNPSVATVDAAGKITALSMGTAIITVTYGTATDTCTVNVGLGSFMPTLMLNNATESAITLNQYTPLDLTGKVSYNGEFYEDAVLSYDVSNTEIGDVTDGLFVPAKAGTTEVTITASWRGATVVESPLLSTTITITVENHWDYTVNGDVIYDVTLYTIAAEGYANTMPFAVEASVNGAPIDFTVALTNGTEYVTYDAENKTLTANGTTGNATISITVEIDGQTLVRTIPVTVLPTIYEHEEVVTSFSAIHGDVADDGQGTYGESLKTLLGEEIVSAYAEDGTVLTVGNGKVFGVFDGLERDKETNMYTRTITVCSQTKGLQMTVTGYSGIFAKAPDLAALNTNLNAKLKLEDGSTIQAPIDAEKSIQKFDNAYFVLANNIDASEYVHEANGILFNQRGISYGFTGGMFNSTFDGQGYTIKGITFNEFGLFGYVKDSTIKNVALVDVKLAEVDYATTLAQWIVGGEVSNVYISIANTQFTKNGAYVTGGFSATKLSAIVVDASAVTTNATSGFRGSFFYRNDEITSATEEVPHTSTFSEVYVISSTVLGAGNNIKVKIEGKDQTVPSSFYAENETAGTTSGTYYFKVEGVKQYASEADMASEWTAGEDTAFNECWDLTGGTPVWKKASEAFPPPVAGGTTEEEGQQSSNQIVGGFNPEWVK